MSNDHPQPLDAAEIPRFAGIPTFMRLPAFTDPAALQVGLVGVPWDGGTTNRAGARHGPREVRNLSSLMRKVHHVSRIAPYDLVRVGDLGDAPVNPIDLLDSLRRIEGFYRQVHAAGTLPLSVGGDHLVTLPIFRALGRERPLGMVHFDAHSDTNDRYFGDNPYTHGTPFRRAIEEGLLDPLRTVQIGIRGSVYSPDDDAFARECGIRVIHMEEFVELGVEATLAEARRVVGDGPTYVSFDVDVLDPAFAPGTGTPEIGGMTSLQAQQLVRGLRGLDLVGADVVEVSPPFDVGGATALVGATMMFELLCLLAESAARSADGVPPARLWRYNEGGPNAMGAGMLGNLNDIDLRMLRTFCAIVEAGGFTAAQARLNTSLSRLSVLVRDLEVRLGYSLCRRGNGGFQLTEEGQELYDAALGLFSDIARFREQVRGLGGRDREALHLGCVDGVIGQHCLPLPLAIRLFRQRAPEVLLKLHTRRPDELEHAVLEERLQLAVGPFTTGCPGSTTNPCSARSRTSIAAARTFFARADDEPTLGEICAADYVGRGYMAENHRPHDLRFNQGTDAYTMEAIATLVFSGTYIGYLPTHYAATWVAEGRMRAIRPRQLAYDSEFHCITRQGHEERPTLTLFLRSLFEAQKQLGVQAPANTNGIARQL